MIKFYQISERGIFAHEEADFGGRDQLLPVAISDGRILKFSDCPQRGQHVLDGHLEAAERVPQPHVLVEASNVLK